MGPGDVHAIAQPPASGEAGEPRPFRVVAPVADDVDVPPLLEQAEKLADDEGLRDARERRDHERYATRQRRTSSSSVTNSRTCRDRVNCLRARARPACAHPGPQGGILRQSLDGRRHGLRVAHGNDEAFDAVRDALANAAAVGHHDRQAARHRLDGGIAESLAQARKDEDVGLPQSVANGHRRERPQQLHVVLERQIVDRVENPLPRRAVADERQSNRNAAIDEPSDRLQRVRRPLDPDERADGDQAQDRRASPGPPEG